MKIDPEIVKSISYSQQEIINNILRLYNNSKPIDLDPCFNKGSFYKNDVVAKPKYRFDIKPLIPSVLPGDVRNLNLKDKSVKCVIFDPPFIVSGQSSFIADRYDYFDSVDQLKDFYENSFREILRVLKGNGLLIIKTQDFINGRKSYSMLDYIFNLSKEMGLIYKDIFILLAKSRPIRPPKKQQHARKYHCYFLVFRKRSIANDN